jgi:endoglucanase
VLSNGLPWLAVADRWIVTESSPRPLLLRGLNRSGLEYAEPGARGFLESAGISEPEISHMVREWRANIIRIPFNQDWALNGRGRLPAAAYLEAIDQVIAWASRAGAYTMLDLHWLDADAVRGRNADGSSNLVPSLPDKNSIVVWSTLARRYRTEPAVLFDIFNEPHDPLRDDPSALEGIREDGTTFPLARRRVTMEEWQPWARHLVRAIRHEHPRSLIFVPGVHWAYDLRGMPLTIANGSAETFRNVVYSTHVYPWAGTPARVRSRTWSPAPHFALRWRDAFGELSRCAPVFVSEWGGGEENVRWGETLARYVRRLGIGWTAWSWSDRPRLVADAQAQRYDPTAFGRLVHRQLAGG